MTEQFANKVETTLAADYTAASGTCTVTSAAAMPATGTFRLRLANSAGTILRVDSRAGAVLTVTVEQDDGNAPAGTAVWHGPTAGALAQLKTDAAAGATSFPWLPSFTALDQSTWAWTNQGGASVTQASNVVLLTVPSAAGQNLRIRSGTAPATPYTITAVMVPNPMWEINFAIAGICLRESATQKVVLVGIQGQATSTVYVFSKYTNATTLSSATGVGPFVSAGAFPLFLRMGDTGVNISLAISHDGRNFTTLLTEARATFFTAAPNEVGIFGNNIATAATMQASFCSWVQS